MLPVPVGTHRGVSVLAVGLLVYARWHDSFVAGDLLVTQYLVIKRIPVNVSLRAASRCGVIQHFEGHYVSNFIWRTSMM